MMSQYMKAELSATITSLGKFVNNKYVPEPQCMESIRDIIRYLRKDDEYHSVRCYLGQSNVVQNDLVPIAICSNGDLFDITIRLLVNLTSPVLLLFKEEIPSGKEGRNLYLTLLAHTQEYKVAFCNIEFWNVIREKLTSLFETDWTERSEDNCLQIELLMVLLRNILQVPADPESENQPDNDITVHDKILWALRESQLLELLLYIASNKYEDRYYLHLLEIFSLLLREQNPTLLAKCEIRRSATEKEKDTKELSCAREKEKKRSFTNVRNFSSTYILKNVKSISDNEVIYHKSLDKMGDLKLTQDKKRLKTPKNRFPVESERAERRSTFSVRLFLKEFCVELLSCSFNNLMRTVKDKLVSGKGLTNDESYYFWSLKFFLEFSCAANSDIKLISECISVETFHFIQMQIEKCYDIMITDKKKIALWVRRLHLMLKAYRSLLQTLMWMDTSKDRQVVETSKVLKSNIFYVVEYRELMLNCMLKYDPYKFPKSFLRDLIEANHLNLKLLEDFCQRNKMIVQKKTKSKSGKTKKRKYKRPAEVETGSESWDKIKGNVFDILESKEQVPELPPFDAASDLPIDDQKEAAMKNIQTFLRNSNIHKAIGLLRSARQVWPENDFFGNNNMTPEEETMALQEICVADLGIDYTVHVESESNEESDYDDDEQSQLMCVEEQSFDVLEYVKRLVNKRVIEGCSILLSNYKRNSQHTNHCLAKLLHRIGWQCSMPSILYQASLFLSMHRILQETDPEYKELQKFSCHLFRKFRENAATNPKIYMELLFWKDPKIAYDVENGYGKSEEKVHQGAWSEEEEDELRKLWVEFDEIDRSVDKIDWIRDNMINQTRSRSSIIRKLKELMLLTPGVRVVKKKYSGREWSTEEISKLTELYTTFKDGADVAELIRERMGENRTKKSIKDKLIELGLVENSRELRKKRSKKQSQAKSKSDKSDSKNIHSEYNPRQAKEALKKIENMKDALNWLQQIFLECIEEDIGDESSSYPLLALNQDQENALQNSDFINCLKELQFQEPSEGKAFWEIAIHDRLLLDSKLDLIKAALSGCLSIESESESEDEFEILKNSLNCGRSKQTPSSDDSQENIPDSNEPPEGRANHPIDSDRSDLNNSDDDLNLSRQTNVRKKKSRPVVFASDSEDEGTSSKIDSFAQKRRRFIGSDSEADENASETEEPFHLREVNKRAKMIGSDSECEGVSSVDGNDVL